MSTYGARASLVDAGEAGALAALPPPEAVAEADEDGRLGAAKGIISAVIFSAPIWVLIVCLIYRLL
ncbi:MAG: hypothetical protein ACJ8AI_14535 [Rhodopila sp.]